MTEIRKLIGIAILALLTVSCGANRGSQYKDQEITQVLTEVLEDLEKRGIHAPVWDKVDSWVFTEDPASRELGHCDKDGEDTKFNLSQQDTGNHVEINKIKWAYLNHFERKTLITHEIIGHCTFNLGHTKYGVMTPYFYFVGNENSYNNLMDNFARSIQ